MANEGKELTMAINQIGQRGRANGKMKRVRPLILHGKARGSPN